ncbi:MULTISPECIES: class I SAM-dependent DNA methyltransferase [unclassified Dolichospermum]|uniref:type I restriction-modification system subunit M n=1 Tax=unclassified Dolichospermum TaxID=2622029 RepID=UPI001444FFAF|nr:MULTISPECIES: class I SAM-dependent DNA methyltransferase [unclassified Dolichospermum]MTJ18639.1 SAM-dependent DNA methyltransferase [Dolichospermum sp. UHCC 0299]MTJ37403.1 SAM-dependent DNA methyltransferase [Dolichospermum sp. UHCC 0406]
MSISTTIKTIQDIMRKDAGVDGDAQRISQLVWMIFLKIFDDREEEYELLDDHYHSPIPEALRWRNWATDSEGMTGDTLLDFVDNVLFKTLKDANTYQDKNPRGFVIKAVFEDAYNYMKNGTLIRQVINKLNEIDFNSSQDRHLFGDIYEQILRDLQSAGNAGEYYTPRAVTQFMVDMIDPKLGERILDPACGTGGFLTCALEHIKNKYVKTSDDSEKLHKLIRGVEKKPLPHLLCMTNMLLHGVEVPAISHDNTLSRPLRDYKPSDRVNVIITNPPFGGMEEDGIESGFPATFRTKETADLFLLLISHLLQDGGRGGIVLPDGTLFGEGVKTRIKEKLLEECNLHTIVRLPNGVFSPYTGIKTNLLFFTKGEATQEIWYYEHPYPPGYKSYSKTKPIRIEEFAPEKAWWHNRIESEFAWKVPIQVIKDNGYNLDIKNPHTVDFEHRDVAEMLEEYASLLDDLGETRNSLKQELMTALGGEFV